MKLQISSFIGVFILSYIFNLNSQEFSYTLINGSTVTEECEICGRPTIPVQIRGNFVINITNQTTIGTRFEIKRINFYAGNENDPDISIKGNGCGEIFGEVAQQVRVNLYLSISKKYGTNRFLIFTNLSNNPTLTLPMVQCEVVQTEDDIFQFYTINIIAAPFNEIWFSTEYKFTPDNLQFIGTPADILSNSGKRIKSKAELINNLNIKDPPDNLSIDSIEVSTNGIILFSLNQSVSSDTIGLIDEGDVVSEDGKIIFRNVTLLNKFGFMPPTPALGLDALQIPDNQKVLFSTRNDAFSESLGEMIQNGDILSNEGYIVKKNRDLLSVFQPSEPDKDYGLDAFYIWDNGDVWFSTTHGFTSQTLGTIRAGDLLCDKGYIVYKNLDLLSKFSPLEDLADFGLDAIFIVTDLNVPVQPPRITSWKIENSSLTFKWQGEGRIYQIEKADNILGPFIPVITTTTKEFIDTQGALNNKAFYRLRQW